MDAVLWSIAAFALGAIPFAVIIGRLLGQDIRQYGDGNPGGTNVGRASGSKLLGALAIAVDMGKGALPVALAHYIYGVDGWALTPVMLGPILGHAYSPFLRFRGGKAIAATFGVWSALTVPYGPFVMALSMLVLAKVLAPRGWAVMAAMLVLLAFLAVLNILSPAILAAWAGTSAILAAKHWNDLVRFPRLRDAVGG